MSAMREETDRAVRGAQGLELDGTDDAKKGSKKDSKKGSKKDSDEDAQSGLELPGANSMVPFGRLTRAAFATGKDLRSFVTTGPRIEPDRDPTVTKELDAVGLGAPIVGDYTRVDKYVREFKPPARNHGQNQTGNQVSFPWSDDDHDRDQKKKKIVPEIPAMTWDVDMENRNKQSLSFNPRRLGKVTQGMDKYAPDEGVIEA
jgi:hypothetical protein